ncbi:HK97 family phage prohead protease [Dehalococcoides mccartyi]|nr:HK97 family phage prohead protease [Dehalococcoides mccartyi]
MAVTKSSIAEVTTEYPDSAVRSGEIVTRWFGVTAFSPSESTRTKSGDKFVGDSVDTGNSITFKVSIESEDRAGDVIRADGWSLDNYRQNPVVLWAHRHDLLPIGKSVDIWIESGALFATIEFAQTEFAQQIQKLFRDGFLRGVSVGFRALKTRPRSDSARRGTIFERQELLEISAAPVPMHPDALATEFGASKTNDSEQRELLPLFRKLTEIWQSIAVTSN